MKRWRPWRVSLRFALLILTILCVWLGVRVHLVRQQKTAVRLIQEAGGTIAFRHQVHWDSAGHSVIDPVLEPNAPRWLRRVLGDEYFQQVDSVNLIDTGITNDWLHNLRMIPDVRLLCLRGTKVTGDGVRHLRDLKNLEVLDLQQCPGLTAETMENLAVLRMLISLDMTGCRAVDDDGLAKIAGLTELRTLAISGSQVTDEGLTHLKDMTEITHIWLGDTSVTDEGLKHLGHMKNLYWLDLRGTGITDEGLKHLTGLKKLWQLVLWDTQATNAGVTAVRSVLPNLKLIAIGPRPPSNR